MTNANSSSPPQVQAAELALGLIDGSERAEAMRRALSDPAFAAEAGYWNTTAGNWLEDIEPVEPSHDLFASIERSLDAATIAKGGHPTAPQLGIRAWAIAASVAAILFAGTAMLALDGQFAPAAPTVAPIAAASVAERQLAGVAQIAGTEGVMVSALYDPASGTMALRIADLSQGDLMPELWVIPRDGKPRSLGLIDRDQKIIALSDEQRLHMVDGSTLAVTLEPKTGAPHEAPTGDILGTSTLQAVRGPIEAL